MLPFWSLFQKAPFNSVTSSNRLKKKHTTKQRSFHNFFQFSSLLVCCTIKIHQVKPYFASARPISLGGKGPVVAFRRGGVLERLTHFCPEAVVGAKDPHSLVEYSRFIRAVVHNQSFFPSLKFIAAFSTREMNTLNQRYSKHQNNRNIDKGTFESSGCRRISILLSDFALRASVFCEEEHSYTRTCRLREERPEECRKNDQVILQDHL